MDLIKSIYIHLQKCSTNVSYTENQRDSFLSASECIGIILNKKIEFELNYSLAEIWKNYKFEDKLVKELKEKKKLTWSEFLESIEKRGFFKGCAKYGHEYRQRIGKAQIKYKGHFPKINFIKKKNLKEKVEADILKKEGNELLKRGKLKEALKNYTKAIKINFNDAILFSNRSVCFNKLKFFEEAIFDAQEAIRIDSTYVKAYNRLANSYKALGQKKEAIEAYRKVMELSIENGENFRHCKQEIIKLKSETGLGKKKLNEKANLTKFSSESTNFNLSSLFKNPSILKLAQNFMSNSNLMLKINEIMKDPETIKKMMNKMDKNYHFNDK